MTTRNHLPNRRHSELIDFRHEGVNYKASVSRFDATGELAEVFLSTDKPGSTADTLARDIAVTTSIALQFGAPIDVLRNALTRQPNGSAAGPLGRLLDEVRGQA